MKEGTGPFKHRQYGGQELGGGDEIYVLRALVLKPEHDVKEPVGSYDLSEALLAYIVILAEAAAQSTAAEKYGSASPLVGKTGLLPKMESGSGSPYGRALTAYAGGAPSVHTAHPWAEPAVFIKIA